MRTTSLPCISALKEQPTPQYAHVVIMLCSPCPFPNPDRLLRPNAFVQVAFSTDGQNRVLVPAEAVVTDDQRSFVFVRVPTKPQRLERRPVSLGRHREGQVEIVDGLAAGETFVSKGALLLLNAVDLAQG